MHLSNKQMESLMGTMRAVDSDEDSDAMWQATLENAATVWGIANNIDIDSHYAFMIYVDLNGE